MEIVKDFGIIEDLKKILLHFTRLRKKMFSAKTLFLQARYRGYISNLRLSEDNLLSIENLAQQRWKVENQGFDVQKRHGYELEHIWCRDSNAMKVVYLLIQIAHLLNQLMIRVELLGLQLGKLSLKSFFKLFLQALTQSWSKELQQSWHAVKARSFQWRDSS